MNLDVCGGNDPRIRNVLQRRVLILADCLAKERTLHKLQESPDSFVTQNVGFGFGTFDLRGG